MVVIFPVLAVWGGTLAIKGQNLRRAGWLVAVQPIVLVVGAIAFVASVTILVRHHAP